MPGSVSANRLRSHADKHQTHQLRRKPRIHSFPVVNKAPEAMNAGNCPQIGGFRLQRARRDHRLAVSIPDVCLNIHPLFSGMMRANSHANPNVHRFNVADHVIAEARNHFCVMKTWKTTHECSGNDAGATGHSRNVCA